MITSSEWKCRKKERIFLTHTQKTIQKLRASFLMVKISAADTRYKYKHDENSC